jgi:hypothetical protein
MQKAVRQKACRPGCSTYTRRRLPAHLNEMPEACGDVRRDSIMATRLIALVLIVFTLIAVPFAARPLRAATPAACTEQVSNGGFESGSDPWQTVSAGGYTILSPILPHTGQWGAVLGAYDNANDELAQTITLPAGTTPTLRFWWQMTTQEADHPWDTLNVTITPAGGGTPVLLRQITDGDTSGVWQQAVVDLASYAGQSMRLSFRAQTDSDRPTDFYLDDISVEACPGSATTPTVTVTPSPTRTATPTATRIATMRRVYLPLVLR